MKKKLRKYIWSIVFIVIILFTLNLLLNNKLVSILLNKNLTKNYKIINEYLTDQTDNLKEIIDLEQKTYSKNVINNVYSIFFTKLHNGNHKKASNNQNSIDRHLIRALKKANKQVYAAVHELDSKNITNTLLSIHKKGVKVKIVTENKYVNEKSIIRLKKAGIPIVDDSTAGKSRLMHNKFFIIDDKWVWTGSLNPTYNGSYKNNNNSILIHSKKLAHNFLSEFKEMFYNKQFGKRSPKTIKYKSITLNDGSIIKTLFAPENNVANKISNEIKNAKKNIYFMAFSFTHNGITKAMINKYKNGIKVMGIFEKRQNNPKYSAFYPMKKAGIMVINDKNKYNMHHKVIIIDDKLTILGSFNFSKNADKRNDENVLIIHSAKIAEVYTNEFKQLYYK